MMYLIVANFANGNNARVRREEPSALAAAASVAKDIQSLEAEHGVTTLLRIQPLKESSSLKVGKTRQGKPRGKKTATAATPATPAGKKR